MWKQFYEVLDSHGLPYCLCKHCEKVFLYPCRIKRGPTSLFTRHINTDCLLYKKKLKRVTSTADDTSTVFNSDISSYFSQSQNKSNETITSEIVKDELVKFFITGNIAFNQAENPHLRKLLSWIKLDDGHTLTINRKNITGRLEELAETAKEDLFLTLADNNSKVSLALDCWSSRNNLAFLGMYL